MGKPFGKAQALHSSQRREREKRWANESEETKDPDKMPYLKPSERPAQERRHKEACDYYRALKRKGYQIPDKPCTPWEERPSIEEIDSAFDRPKHVNLLFSQAPVAQEKQAPAQERKENDNSADNSHGNCCVM